MAYEFTAKLAELMCEGDKGLPKLLLEQKTELEKRECTSKNMKKWFDDFELPVLVETLNLPDKYFRKKFSGLTSFNLAKRRAFAEKLQKHSETCGRCKTKVLFDRQWEEKFDKLIFQHKNALTKMLSEETI